jgi:type I restriction enzyme S subunit
MATVRPNLQAFAMIPEGTNDCVASTGFAVLTAKPEINASYIDHYLFSGHISSQIEALVVGSNYPAIGSKEVGNLVIRIPGLEQQTRIAQVLNESSQSIACQRRRLEAVRLERSALMELLLTGKRRLNMDKEKAA